MKARVIVQLPDDWLNLNACALELRGNLIPKRERTVLNLSGIQRLNPKGILSLSPGLRGASYPGKKWVEATNPNGVAALRGKPVATPSGLKSVRQATQGSSFLAILGWLTQSRWDCKTAGFPAFRWILPLRNSRKALEG